MNPKRYNSYIEEETVDNELGQVVWKVLVIGERPDSEPREILLTVEGSVKIGRNPPDAHDIRIAPYCLCVSRNHGEIITREVDNTLECYFRDTGSMRGSFVIGKGAKAIRLRQGMGADEYPVENGMIIRLGGENSSEKTCDIQFVKVTIPKTECR